MSVNDDVEPRLLFGRQPMLGERLLVMRALQLDGRLSDCQGPIGANLDARRDMKPLNPSTRRPRCLMTLPLRLALLAPSDNVGHD